MIVPLRDKYRESNGIKKSPSFTAWRFFIGFKVQQ